MNLATGLLRASPAALMVLVGLGAAGWLFGRSRAAGGVLALGMVLVGFDLLLDLTVFPALGALADFGILGWDGANLAFAGARLLTALVHSAGVVAVLVAICVGPAPARVEEEA